MNERYYSWSLVTYSNPEDWKELLMFAKHYAYIRHDKELCESHYHILLTFEQCRSLNWIRKRINSNQNTLGQYMKDKFSAFEYLTHQNDTEKILYEKSSIVTDDVNFWLHINTEVEKNDEFIDDLLNLTPFEMAKKYGRDYIKNYTKYDNFRLMLVGFHCEE